MAQNNTVLEVGRLPELKPRVSRAVLLWRLWGRIRVLYFSGFWGHLYPRGPFLSSEPVEPTPARLSCLPLNFASVVTPPSLTLTLLPPSKDPVRTVRPPA